MKPETAAPNRAVSDAERRPSVHAVPCDSAHGYRSDSSLAWRLLAGPTRVMSVELHCFERDQRR
jgi:hypothetical protein